MHDRDDTPELVDVHRFTNRWEKTASLDLRHGRTSVIDTYLKHDRILSGETETMIDAAYAAWHTDMQAGCATVLVTDSVEAVTDLNTRARTDLILNGTVKGPREVSLHDGTSAAVGDTVITRHNDRRLRVARGWVRNGDRWKATDVRRDGSVTVRRANKRWAASVVLPASYVTEHLELGYAVTSYRAQGVTTDTAHVLVDPSMTRENLYVAMTRGRNRNTAYVAIDKSDGVHEGPHPGDNDEANARSVLYGVLQHVGTELSAHQTIAAEQEAWSNIGQLAAEYETIAAAAQHDRWAALLRDSGLTEQEADDAITSDTFPALAAEFRRAEANHHDLAAPLPRLIQTRGLGDADDIAAVLHARVAHVTARPAGSGRRRKPPRLIAGLIPEATGPMADDMRTALDERSDLIEGRADALLDTALAEQEPWAARLGQVSDDAKRAQAWRRQARIVVAYRDRYRITDDHPIGAAPDNTAQKIDAARARTALDMARDLANPERNDQSPVRPTTAGRVGPTL